MHLHIKKLEGNSQTSFILILCTAIPTEILTTLTKFFSIYNRYYLEVEGEQPFFMVFKSGFLTNQDNHRAAGDAGRGRGGVAGCKDR